MLTLLRWKYPMSKEYYPQKEVTIQTKGIKTKIYRISIFLQQHFVFPVLVVEIFRNMQFLNAERERTVNPIYQCTLISNSCKCTRFLKH